MVVQVWVGVGVEGYRCVGGCWCGRLQVFGCGRVEVFEWVLVWRGRGV